MMRLLSVISFLLILSVLTAPSSKAQEAAPPVLPTPQQWTWQDGQLEATAITQIVVGSGATEGDRFAARQLQQTLAERYDVEVDVRTEQGKRRPEGAIMLGAPASSALVRRGVQPSALSDTMAAEGYVLKVDARGVVIAGASEAGRFYGAMTLRQLLEAGTGTLRGVTITDYPKMKFRGVSDDISRGPVSTLENFKKIIRFLARYKMNVYTPYIEDVLEFDAYPSIGKGRGALSKEDVRALQDYAAKWHVEIIPTFQTLGHYANILNMDAFVKYAEYPGAASLNTQDPETYAFLEALLDEVAALFDSEYVHIGVDEAWDVGKGASKEAVEEKGAAAVIAEHARKVYDMLRARGKKVMMYGDMPMRHPDTSAGTLASFEGIPDDVIFIDWQYAATDDFPSTDIFAKAKRPFIIGTAIQNWRRVYPNQTAAWTNIYHATLAGYRDGALGAIVHGWGDEGGPNFRELNYRGYAYAAACAWNPTGAQQATIDARFNRLFYGHDGPELHALEALLTRLSHDVYFRDVGEHPFNTVEHFPKPRPGGFPGKAVPVVASFRELPILVVAANIQESARAALELIEAVQPELPYNKDQLDYHAWVARLARWFGERMEYAEWIYDTRRDFGPEERAAYREKGVRWGQQLRQEIEQLAADYKDLWLRTSRPANLSRLMTLFAYQEAYLEDIVASVQEDRWTVPIRIASDFVTAPGTSGEEGRPTVYLRHAFSMDKGRTVEQATLQLAGDTQANVWLNGEALGRVIAQGTLSLEVKKQRVKTWDVTERLRLGENVLAAQATSYGRSEPGAANLYLEIHYADGTQERVLSGADWKARSEKPSEGWTQTGYDDERWPAAQTVNRETLSAPMFERGLPSRIE